MVVGVPPGRYTCPVPPLERGCVSYTVVCVTKYFVSQTGLNVCRLLVACPVVEDENVSSGSDTDSDLEDEGDEENLEVAEVTTPTSL